MPLYYKKFVTSDMDFIEEKKTMLIVIYYF